MAEWLECQTPDQRDQVRNPVLASRWFGTDMMTVLKHRLPLPTYIGQHGKVGQQNQHAKDYKAMAPQSPAALKESMTKEAALGVLRISGLKRATERR